MRRRTWLLIGLGAVLLLAAGAAIATWLATRPVGDIHNGASLPFTASTGPPPSSSVVARRFGPPWPFYGRTAQRSRDASDLVAVHPPYRVVWESRGNGLVEFPPSYQNGKLYLATDAGFVLAMNANSGERLWRHKFGQAPDEPAVVGNRVYFSTIDRPGRVYALGAHDGHVVWRATLPGQVESSPVVWDGKVFVGDLLGNVRALDAQSGRTVWQFRAAGPVKDSIAIDNGRAFFGSYGGWMYCLGAGDGRRLWSTQTHGLAGGFRSGNFYATPAVAYGRVYISNTDHKVYSFVESTGQIAWSSTLPDWAYGSPGVAYQRVFATSYDGTVAAMDARTGRRLWTRKLPYRTLGSPTVVGRLVYVSDLGASPGHGRGHTYAFDPWSGRVKWRFPDGKYHGVVSGMGRLVVAGVSHLYSLKPLG